MNIWKIVAITSSTLCLAMIGNTVRVAHADEQPLMEAAGQYLKATENVLERATTDKGGHRVAALKLVRQAQDEVQAGIKWDNEHKSKSEKH